MKVWLKKAKRWWWVWVQLSENRRFIHKQLLTRTSASRQTTFLSRRAALAGAVISHCSLEKRSNMTTQQTCRKAGTHGASTHCNSVGSVGDTSDCLWRLRRSGLLTADNLKTCTFSQTVHELIQLKSGGWPPARRQCSFQVQFSLSYKPGNWLTDYTFYHWWNNWCRNTSLCF